MEEERRGTIAISIKTRQKIAVVKAENGFRRYDNAVDFLVFVYRIFVKGEEEREKLKATWLKQNEKKEEGDGIK